MGLFAEVTKSFRSGRVVYVDEFVLQTKLHCHVRRHRRCTITFGGVVAARKKRNTALACQVHLWLRDFAGDEGLRSSRNGGFKIPLRTTCAPGNAIHRACMPL